MLLHVLLGIVYIGLATASPVTVSLSLTASIDAAATSLPELENDQPIPSTASPPHYTSNNLVRRQGTTSTLGVSTTDLGIATSATSSVTPTAPIRLRPASAPIPLAPTIGLIMPDPFQPVYVDLNYTFGFVDTVPHPAPTVGGWLRQVQPLLIFPSYLVNVFPSSGQSNVNDSGAVPFGSDGLCGATAEAFPIGYPFTFKKAGWYMFVVNQTWLQADVTDNNTCANPLLGQRNFFASQTFSVAPLPTTNGPEPPSPTTAYTHFATVAVKTPGALPVDPHDPTKGERLAVGLGVAGGVLGLMLIVLTVWGVRHKRQNDADALAFSRLSPADQAAFLTENPDSRLNPSHRSRFRHRVDVPSGPPAPPGTLAYAQWYWHQMRAANHLRPGYHQNSVQYGYAIPQAQQAYGAAGAGYGYGQDSVPRQAQAYGPVQRGTAPGYKMYQ